MMNINRLVSFIVAFVAVVVLGVTGTVDDVAPWVTLLIGAALPLSPVQPKGQQ